MIEIRFDDRKLKQVERQLRNIPKALPRVMTRSLNRTANTARTLASRSLSSQLGLRVKDVRSRISVLKATYHHWRSAIIIKRKMIPLTKLFKVRQTVTGVSYKRTAIPHAFIATMPSGHTGVFLRARYAKGRYIPMKSKAGREAIYEQGISLGQAFTQAQAEADRIYRQGLQTLEKNINDQVRLILARRMPA